METHGWLAPETEAAARARYEDCGQAARTVVKEVTRAMEFEPREYDRRVDREVIATAREALFASVLAVRVGERTEYEDWRADYGGTVEEAGSEHVDRVAWHVAPLAGRAVAATFQDEERAAVATLRRQAFGRLYREVLP